MKNVYLIWQLEHQHEVLNELVSVDDFMLREDPDKWSIHEIVCHLGSYQQHYHKRIQKILTSDNPSFKRYRADEDANFKIWLDKDPNSIIELYNSNRKIFNEVISAIPIDKFSRTANHPFYGDMTLEEWIRFFLFHENHHLFSIFRSKRIASK